MLAILFALAGCGGGGGGGNGNGDTTQADFGTFQYIDERGIGIEAFQMIVPADWEFSGGITWHLENPGAPAVANFSVKAPTGEAELELLPAQPFFSTQDPMALSFFPVGSRYYGNEVRKWPPLGPLETLKQIVIPKFRSDVKDLQIIEQKELPEVADLLRVGLPPQPSTEIAAAMVRIEYEQRGIQMEEEIYCIVETHTFQLYMGDSALWMADYLFSFKAEKGMLDHQYKLFQTMMYSFRLNPQWFNKYVQLIDYLVRKQLDAIQDLAELSRIISETTDEIDSMVWKSYNNRNEASDRMAENFSNYIRGTDTYDNPFLDSHVKLPSGSANAWANALGEYILSDDVNYNPNIGSTQNWRLLNPSS